VSGINQLSEASEASTSMQVPVYDTTNGQPRRISVQQLVDLIQDSLISDASAPFRLINVTVAELAADYPAASWTGAIVYCSNGASGSPCLAVSNGTNWLRIALGAAVAA
jgi:hypothetical protein